MKVGRKNERVEKTKRRPRVHPGSSAPDGISQLPAEAFKRRDHVLVYIVEVSFCKLFLL